jgi:choline dehydrogenase
MEVGGFVESRAGLDRPDMIVSMVPMAFGGSYGESAAHGFEIYIELVGCTSRGSVAPRSADPAERPTFRFNFLREGADVAALQAGTALARELVRQPAYGELAGEETSPGPAVATAGEVEAWLRRSVGVTHHLAGSCRMGPAGDPGAVVGPDLRVHGLLGLRVVDASVMPRVTSGNTHAPVIMIAEKAADMILGR